MRSTPSRPDAGLPAQGSARGASRTAKRIGPPAVAYTVVGVIAFALTMPITTVIGVLAAAAAEPPRERVRFVKSASGS